MLAFGMTLLLGVFALIQGQNTGAKTLRIGAVISRYPDTMNRRNDGWGWENVGSAIQIAVEKFEAAGGLIGGMKIEIRRVDDSCAHKTGVKVLMNLLDSFNPNVVMGPSCSAVIATLGLVLSYYNVAFWPYGGTEPSLENKITQNTMVRIHATGSKIGTAFTHVFHLYNWKRVVMLTSVTYCDMGARGIVNEFNKNDIKVADWVETLSVSIENSALDDYLDRLRQRGRIFIVCFDDWDSHQRFYERAKAKGMATPEYVYLFYSIRGAINDRILRPWLFDSKLSPAQAARNRELYYFYKQVTLTTLSGNDIVEFYKEIPEVLAGSPYYYNESKMEGWEGSWQAVNLHDLTLTYLSLVNEMIARGENYNNGSLVREKMIDKRIGGDQLQSPLLYDENADRIPNFWFWSLSPDKQEFEVTIEMIMTDPPEKRMHFKAPVYWGTPDNQPPPDEPVCGYRGEKCHTEEGLSTQMITASVIPAVVVVIIIIACIWYFVMRQRKKEYLIRQMLWKVKLDDIEITKSKSDGNKSKNRSADTDSEITGHEDSTQPNRTIAQYNESQVYVTFIGRDQIILQKKDLMELNKMREMQHDNINSFVGACTDPPRICYLMSFCGQGSLQDILQNDSVKLDWTFKLSLIMDLANGMSYLHRSDLLSHGNLKSSNCLVDSRWTLKVSGYGLRVFREGNDTEDTDYERYYNLLWTAPEFLRMPHKPFYGSQKGDVYSFSIILHELVYRTTPYSVGDTNTPKDVIQRVARGVEPPFRPRLQELVDDTNPALLDLMIICWYEDPNDRPDFDICKKKILALNNGKKIDVMGSVLEKLEKYATNLESVVSQRTSELVEEKQKTDVLLYSMMPKSIAEKLKHGGKVTPEIYQEVTVYFSDIVGFQDLATSSTPMQIVDFLNDLYSLFDNTIPNHDVYKVETISDSYMVVSGLPNRNGVRHVGEIADMALELMSAVYTEFQVRHKPTERTKLRVGMHTGMCAAGVVGLSMPRFCLFGDTVNTASRMETSGEPLKIHMSEAAYHAIRRLNIYKAIQRGEVQIKGKGMVMTYWLVGKEGFMKPLPIP